MWIDRLEFIGFGNLTGQGIDFARDKKISVVVQANESGKSTISDAIWAILYDYAENSLGNGVPLSVERKPLSGAAFKACLDIVWNQRNIRLIRNFSDRSLKVLDLSKDPGKATAD